MISKEKHEEKSIEKSEIAAEEDDELLKLLDEVESDVPPSVPPDAPVEEKKIESQVPSVKTEIIPVPPPPEFEKTAFYDLARRFSSVAETVVRDAQLDRKKLDELIDHASKNVISRDQPQAAMVEAWVNSLAKKAETNIALTKLLDSIAKLLAASKNNDIFVQVNNAGGDEDLRKLLDQPENEEGI